MSEWTKVGELAALGTALLWTCSAMAWTSAGRRVGTLPVCFIRLVITCGFLLAYGRLLRGLWLPSDASSETWRLLSWSGFVGFFLADLCLLKALLLIGPRLTLLFQTFSPPFAALISKCFVREGLTSRQWLAMAVTLAGVIWVVLERADGPHGNSRRDTAVGMLLAVLAAVGQAVGLVLSRRGIGQYDAAAATFIRIIPALIGFVVLLTVVRAWPAVTAATRDRRAMVILTLGALVGPFLGVILSMIAVRHCHAGVAATILSTMPVLILPMVVVVYRERVSLRAALGAVISVAGVALLVMH
jgi:drug/metabolite transporter (DMT)-like permease